MYEKIKDFGNAFGQAHRACKKIFDLRHTKTKEKHGEKGSKVDFNLDKNFGSSPPEAYCKYANVKNTHVEI